MRHEPRAFVGNPEHPMKLMCAHPLLAGAQEVIGKQPLVKRDVRVRKYRSDRDGKFLAAARAFPDTFANVRLSVFCWIQAVGFPE